MVVISALRIKMHCGLFPGNWQKLFVFYFLTVLGSGKTANSRRGHPSICKHFICFRISSETTRQITCQGWSAQSSFVLTDLRCCIPRFSLKAFLVLEKKIFKCFKNVSSQHRCHHPANKHVAKQEVELEFVFVKHYAPNRMLASKDNIR